MIRTRPLRPKENYTVKAASSKRIFFKLLDSFCWRGKEMEENMYFTVFCRKETMGVLKRSDISIKTKAEQKERNKPIKRIFLTLYS